jgi:phage baseplate assembly protein gpV
MANYAPSTRARIADLITGMHVKTTDGVLVAANFTDTAQTELFTIVGRLGVTQLFIEITSAADANATQVLFNVTFTTPAIGVNAMCAKCASIGSVGAHTRITWVGGAVATAAVITDSAGLTDVEAAGKIHIVGGETAAGANTVGTIGMLADDATQAATISATAHLFYFPMSKGAYAEALV